MKKIVFIVPYFGNFPPWMDYFLASCKANDDIHFIFFSDNAPPEKLPGNIAYQQITYQDYLDLVSHRLGISFHPADPYKLCDLKPALGLVHEDLITGYSFWGFCDVDMVFGDISAFVSESVLDQYCFLTALDRRVAGHFTLIKNNYKYNRAFMSVPAWQDILSDKQHRAFDEKHFSDLFIGFKNYPAWLRKVASWLFLPWSRKALCWNAFATPGMRYGWTDGSRVFPSEWYWCEGVLTNNRSDKEFLYFHFLAWKREWASEMLDTVSSEEKDHKWRVTSRGFEAISSLLCLWSHLFFA